MSGGQEYWHDKNLEETIEEGRRIHNQEASELGLSPHKYTIAKNIRLLLSEHKATLPFYYTAMMQKEVDSLFKKEISNLGWFKYPDYIPEYGIYNTDIGPLCWDSDINAWLEPCEYMPWEPVIVNPTRFYKVPEYKEMDDGEN